MTTGNAPSAPYARFCREAWDMSPHCHIAVAADQSLIADTVSAALVGPTMRVTRVPWRDPSVPRAPRPRFAEPVDVGLMLCDLQPLARLVQAQRMVHAAHEPWLVLTGAPRGPLWGAMLGAGAVAVQRSSASLDEVRAMVGRILAGESLMAEAEVAELREAWLQDERARRAAVESVRSLSPRETVVLALMHAGEPVQQIAERLEVSESTVRSHVRAVLRKLDVKTQLAAVAEFETANVERDHEIGEWPVER